jgi:GNAT superfamily N-acetyltransferase
MKIEISDLADPGELASIHSCLTDHARAAGVTPRDHRPLHVCARDEAGRVVGGLSGATIWGWLEVKLLWVSEGARGGGLGGQLLDSAEAEARARGCHHAHLDTFDFQAPAFYERRGYQVFGRLDDFPRGHARFFLMKAL